MGCLYMAYTAYCVFRRGALPFLLDEFLFFFFYVRVFGMAFFWFIFLSGTAVASFFCCVIVVSNCAMCFGIYLGRGRLLFFLCQLTWFGRMSCMVEREHISFYIIIYIYEDEGGLS